MSIVVEHGGEPYCLVVDQVGDVVSVDVNEVESNPGSMNQDLAGLSAGVVKMEHNLIVMLDLDRLFGLSQSWAA
jgi:purine-binding chemotaxis protein CheW